MDSPDSEIRIRQARVHDIGFVQEIYSEQVLNGVATFEELPPSVDEMTRRLESIVASKLPYLVADREGAIVGYCYATAYRPRAAYRYTIENSVYVARSCRRQGVGRLLLGRLIESCEAGPWHQMIAVIGDSGNAGSIALHEAHGFAHVGCIRGAGFKFGRWVDTVLMQIPLNGGIASMPAD